MSCNHLNNQFGQTWIWPNLDLPETAWPKMDLAQNGLAQNGLSRRGTSTEKQADLLHVVGNLD